MAELHLTDIDDKVLARLRKQAQQKGISLEDQVRALLQQEAEEDTGDSDDTFQTLRMPPAGLPVFDPTRDVDETLTE